MRLFAFGWSGGWVLVGAFLLVLLRRYSQNRDTRAIQLELDELTRSLGDARTHHVGLEQLPDEELQQTEDEFPELRSDVAAPDAPDG